MTRHDDLDLALARDLDAQPNGGDASWTSPHRRGPLVAAVVLVVCLAAGLWFWWSQSSPQPAPAADTADPPGTDVDAPSRRLGEGDAADLPPLDALDPVLRGMLGTLSARPELARLLATDNLLRRFVAAVDGIGRGTSPARHIGVLRPTTPFSVERPYNDSAIPAATYARYAGVVATIAELDTAELARLYAALRPRLDEAYAELGGPAESFDAAMERAIAHLLAVDPALAAGQVRPSKGVTYAWANDATERLSPAQKHLLRLGPDGARRVQDKLRDLAQALGIPAARLPNAARTTAPPS